MIHIDPEFHAYIPPLSDEERAQLERKEPFTEHDLRLVYFLEAGPFIKIGRAKISPTKRIRQLQTGCPYPIKLLLWLPGGSDLERRCHRRFAHLRAQGEWFHRTPELLAGMREIQAEQYQ